MLIANVAVDSGYGKLKEFQKVKLLDHYYAGEDISLPFQGALPGSKWRVQRAEL